MGGAAMPGVVPGCCLGSFPPAVAGEPLSGEPCLVNPYGAASKRRGPVKVLGWVDGSLASPTLLGTRNSFAAAVFAARGVDQRLVYLHSFDAACLVFRV